MTLLRFFQRGICVHRPMARLLPLTTPLTIPPPPQLLLRSLPAAAPSTLTSTLRPHSLFTTVSHRPYRACGSPSLPASCMPVRSLSSSPRPARERGVHSSGRETQWMNSIFSDPAGMKVVGGGRMEDCLPLAVEMSTGERKHYSYVSGPTSTPLLTDTIGGLFDARARDHKHDRILNVVEQNIEWSWGDLKERVDAFARGLLRLGYVKGDRLGIWMPNNSEWLIAQVAASKLGVIVVNINPAYRKHELQHSLNLVGCKGLVLVPELKSSDYVKMMYEICPELNVESNGELHSAAIPSLRHLIHACDEPIGPRGSAWTRFDECMLDSVSAKAKIPDRVLDDITRSQNCFDPINLQFTSGTTGLPKGVGLTHHNILNNGAAVGAQIGLSEDDALILPVPLYHCFGTVLGNLACLIHRSQIIYASASFEPKAVLAAVQRYKATALHGVPTMFIAMLSHPDFAEYDVSSLRTGVMAGSNCPEELMRRCKTDLNMRDITIAYGMTETSPVSFQTSPNDSIEKQVSTIGRVLPHVEAKIVDPTTGETLPVGEVGEFCSRGYILMKGYWNNEEETKNAIDEDGWIHSGDLASIDKDGYCRIEGRIKDLVIRGGENISPREIEEVLMRHKGVRDVQIVGVPDRKYGEELCAWIIPESSDVDEGQLRTFLQDELAHFKVPRYWLFDEEFPMTVTGKIQKFKLRQLSQQRLALYE